MTAAHYIREQLETMTDEELDAVLAEAARGETWAGIAYTLPREAAIDAVLALQGAT